MISTQAARARVHVTASIGEVMNELIEYLKRQIELQDKLYKTRRGATSRDALLKLGVYRNILKKVEENG